MTYIMINGTKYPCKIQPFITQFGQKAIRIISNAPVSKKGFALYNDDDLIADMSAYKKVLRNEDTIKEYVINPEPIIGASGYISDIPENPIQRQLDNINRRISDITPFTASKEAGIQDTVCIFDGEFKDGILTASVITSKGESKACEVERSGDNITVRFAELTETATVSITIQ